MTGGDLARAADEVEAICKDRKGEANCGFAFFVSRNSSIQECCDDLDNSSIGRHSRISMLER